MSLYTHTRTNIHMEYVHTESTSLPISVSDNTNWEWLRSNFFSPCSYTRLSSLIPSLRSSCLSRYENRAGRRRLSSFLNRTCDALRRSAQQPTGYQRDAGGKERREPVESCADTSHFLSSSIFSVSGFPQTSLTLSPSSHTHTDTRSHPCTVSTVAC